MQAPPSAPRPPRAWPRTSFDSPRYRFGTRRAARRCRAAEEARLSARSPPAPRPRIQSAERTSPRFAFLFYLRIERGEQTRQCFRSFRRNGCVRRPQAFLPVERAPANGNRRHADQRRFNRSDGLASNTYSVEPRWDDLRVINDERVASVQEIRQYRVRAHPMRSPSGPTTSIRALSRGFAGARARSCSGGRAKSKASTRIAVTGLLTARSNWSRLRFPRGSQLKRRLDDLVGIAGQARRA